MALAVEHARPDFHHGYQHHEAHQNQQRGNQKLTCGSAGKN
jgi:hypothetical protein